LCFDEDLFPVSADLDASIKLPFSKNVQREKQTSSARCVIHPHHVIRRADHATIAIGGCHCSRKLLKSTCGNPNAQRGGNQPEEEFSFAHTDVFSFSLMTMHIGDAR
jgi:hypothetical protein